MSPLSASIRPVQEMPMAISAFKSNTSGVRIGGSGKSSRDYARGSHRPGVALRHVTRNRSDSATAGISYQNTLGPASKCNRRRGKVCPWPLPGTPAVLRCTRISVSCWPTRLPQQGAFWNKSSIYQLRSVARGPKNPRWRDDDLTSNVFRSNARVDTLARCAGIVASRGLGR